MFVGSYFELITHLQYKVKSLTFQVQAVESGDMYVSMRSEFDRQLAAKDREIKLLKRELGDVRHQVVAVRKNWTQVFEDVAKEHDKELRGKDRVIQDRKNRISQMQMRLDETKDMLKAKNLELYSVKTELEEQQGANLQLKAQLDRDYENASIDKIRELLSDMTDGQLQISKGMINGLSKEFSAKTEREQKKAFADLLVSPVMNTDFTNARVNGKSAQVIVCATPNSALYFARENKGHKGVVGTPVEQYRGILGHDHDLTFYNYGDSHQECLSHALRYLKNSIENEPNLTCNQKMLELMREMIHYRNSNEIPAPDEIQKYKSKYLEIMKLVKKEYEYEPPSQYYRDGYNLYMRMDGYMENHLLFLHDFRVPSNNNLSDRKLRVFKRKQKQVMGFRSFESLSHLCSSMSMIDLLRSREHNLQKSVALVFE